MRLSLTTSTKTWFDIDSTQEATIRNIATQEENTLAKVQAPDKSFRKASRYLVINFFEKNCMSSNYLKVLWVNVLLVCSSWVNLNAQSNTFQKVYFGEPDENMARLGESLITPDGGLLVGNTLTLLKIDSMGNTQFRKRTEITPFIATSPRVFLPRENRYVAIGSVMFLYLDTNYNISSIRQINSPNHSFHPKVAKNTNDKGFVIGTGSAFNNIDRSILAKVDSLGNIQWAKSYNSQYSLGIVFGIVVTQDGGYMAVTGTPSLLNPGNTADCVVFKTDSNGIVQWAKSITYLTSSSVPFCISPTHDGNFVVTGWSTQHRFLLKLDDQGNVHWFKRYEIPINGDAKWVSLTSDHGFIMTGVLNYVHNGIQNWTTILLKTDSVGDVQWARIVGDVSGVWSHHVVQTSDGGYYLTVVRDFIQDAVSISIIKTDSLGYVAGCTDLTPAVNVITVNDTVIDFILTDSLLAVNTFPASYSFPNFGTEYDYCSWIGLNEIKDQERKMKVMPNPASDRFILQFDFPLYQSGKFELVNMLGEVIHTQYIASGTANVSVDPNIQIPYGIYICKVTSLNWSDWVKVIVAR